MIWLDVILENYLEGVVKNGSEGLWFEVGILVGYCCIDLGEG